MVFTLVIMNMLSLKIYKVMELGWRDMQFKLEGIRQTKHMLTIIAPPIEDEDISEGEEDKEEPWYETWP